MKRSGWTLVEVLVCTTIIVIILGLLIPAFMQVKNAPVNQKSIPETSVAFSGSIRTIEHDGHLFTIWVSGSGGAGSMLHSPNCPCLKRAD